MTLHKIGPGLGHSALTLSRGISAISGLKRLEGKASLEDYFGITPVYACVLKLMLAKLRGISSKQQPWPLRSTTLSQ